MYSEGKYTFLDPPESDHSYTQANSINDSGQVAGTYYDGSDISHGFVYSNGQYMTLDVDVPGATYTSVVSINASGQVAGSYWDGSIGHGFVYSQGKYTTLDVPGFYSTMAISLNDRGQVVVIGFANDDDPTPAVFVYSNGQYTFLNNPYLSGTIQSTASSINNRGQVVGSYEYTEDAWHGFIATPIDDRANYDSTALSP